MVEQTPQQEIKSTAESPESSDKEALISDTESVGSQNEAGAFAKAQPDANAPEEYTEEENKRAEEFKEKGNGFFKDNKYEAAIDLYTEAIFCKIGPIKKAVYYCNRSLANLRLENSSIALFDACEAIKFDEKNVKGYYRRGQAQAALNQMQKAVESFKKVCVMQPQNADARGKYQTVQKQHRQEQLAKAVERSDDVTKYDDKEIDVPASYDGPRIESFDDITPEWIQNLMEYQAKEKRLHKKYVVMLINEATKLFAKQDSLVHVPVDDLEEITVCGDIHGQYYDLINIFKINGMPSEENPYLFNGDFVDRGSFCAEVMCCMLSWKICLPQHFHMNRGNHEAKTLTSMYGFSGEITHKYDKRVYDLFCQMFQHIPLCHILNKQVMVNHGGLFSRDDISLEDIKKINRVREPPDNGPMCELMWSDPDDKDGRHPSKRGCGIAFGPDVAAKFLEKNGLKLLVRAHEVKQEGFEYQAGGKVVTVFSAPNYCDQMGNKGAYCRFQGATMEPKITSFEKSPHPNLRPMQYASFGSMFS